MTWKSSLLRRATSSSNCSLHMQPLQHMPTWLTKIMVERLLKSTRCVDLSFCTQRAVLLTSALQLDAVKLEMTAELEKKAAELRDRDVELAELKAQHDCLIADATKQRNSMGAELFKVCISPNFRISLLMAPGLAGREP